MTPALPRRDVERIVGGARVALAVSSLLAIWLDPAEPARYVSLTYSLHAIYVVYSLVLFLLAWRRASLGRWPLATQVTDIVVASVFQYLTLGPSSPFFVYFVFALFSSALRWGSRGTVKTAVVVLIAFIVMGASLSRTLGPQEFELNRFIIRIAYLIVVSVLLTYLGQHEERVREEVRRLARWPLAGGRDLQSDVAQILEHSARIVGAARVTVVWEKDDEPWMYVSSWPAAERAIERHPPGTFEPLVAPALEGLTFALAGARHGRDLVFTSRAGNVATWTGSPVHETLCSRLPGPGLSSAPFRTDRLTGRVFFAGLGAAGVDAIPLLEVVGREAGAALDQLYSYERSREIAIAEDRIRLARDLHDGVLQSLTSVRLELQGLANGVEQGARPTAMIPDRLRQIERTLAADQRELREFIADLKPSEAVPLVSLEDRLNDLKHRIELHSRVQVCLKVRLGPSALAPLINRSVPLMVHEAIMNALKHANPSRVTVDVTSTDHTLAIAVEDDGRGFTFSGRQDHEALVAANAGPISLRERVSSLGGQLAIESSPAGSRVELYIPLQAVNV